ncbi:MAG: DUF4373 domain-containing protein [Proteobacteria bacterium]|nr:DUF4373 domain-containing protein [Pseudomonadota bacterium]
MTGRPKKTTVNYFPHFTTSGKTLFTLESLYGNDGYAFWFKLLEILGGTENHTFRYENTADWLFLVAKTKVSEEKAILILQTLADLGAIDAELHKEQTVWSDNFISGLLPVYDKRSTEIPTKPTLRVENTQAPVFSVEKTPRSKGSKGKEAETPLVYSDRFEEFWKAYPRKKGKSKAYTYWKKYGCDNGLFNTVMDSLSQQKKSKDWIKDGGQFVPHGSTWVFNRAWEDGDDDVLGTCEVCNYLARMSCDGKKNGGKICGGFVPTVKP